MGLNQIPTTTGKTLEEKSKVAASNYEKALSFTFILFLLTVVATRALIFLDINIPFIDSDQPFMWAAVKDYSEGRFYEPRFYGQNYNTFIEALVAVPLYKMSMPVYYALPIATHIITLFPFLFTSCYLFFKGKKENALLVLGVLLCLPTGYDIMTGIPRGFVPGLLFTSFFVVSVFNSKNKSLILLNTFMAIAGYFVNPNSVLVSAPFLFFIFLNNYRDKNYYCVTSIGLLSAIPLYLLFDLFYKLHPDYVILKLEYSMTTDYFWNILSNLDTHFAHITFFAEKKSILLLIVLFSLTIVLFKNNKNAFYTCLVFFALLLFSFFSAKIKDGIIWPFYSYSRMYVSIPFFIALMSAFIPLRSKKITVSLVLIVTTFSACKLLDFKKSVIHHTTNSRWHGVHLVSLSAVLNAAEIYEGHCHINNADHFLISNGFWACTYLNYGGPVFKKNFPSTEETNSERRYWVREENKNKVFGRFIFLSVNYNLDKVANGKYNFEVKRLDDYGLFLITNNTLINKDFITLAKKLETQ